MLLCYPQEWRKGLLHRPYLLVSCCARDAAAPFGTLCRYSPEARLECADNTVNNHKYITLARAHVYGRKVAVTDEPERQPLCVMAFPERFLLRHMSKTNHRTRMVFLAQQTGRPDSAYYPVGITEDYFQPDKYKSALQWASYNFKGTLIDRNLQAPKDPRFLLNFLAQMSSAVSESSVPKVEGNSSVESDEALEKMYTLSSPARYLILPRRLRSLSTADDCSAMLSDGTPVFFPKFFMGTKSLYALQTEMRVLDAFISNLQKHRPPSQFVHALIVRCVHSQLLFNS